MAKQLLSVQVCLMGSRDEFVASGSDDGRIFIWDRISGRLINMLTSDDQNVTCVTAHPSIPVLASAGSEPIIKLWSPQASADQHYQSKQEVLCRMSAALLLLPGSATSEQTWADTVACMVLKRPWHMLR